MGKIQTRSNTVVVCYLLRPGAKVFRVLLRKSGSNRQLTARSNSHRLDPTHYLLSGKRFGASGNEPHRLILSRAEKLGILYKFSHRDHD
jgi:hypothetical protein